MYMSYTIIIHSTLFILFLSPCENSTYWFYIVFQKSFTGILYNNNKRRKSNATRGGIKCKLFVSRKRAGVFDKHIIFFFRALWEEDVRISNEKTFFFFLNYHNEIV